MPAPDAEIYLEFAVVGNVMKATAIDPKSGVEASVVGPASESARPALREAALRKLDTLLKKRSG